MVALFVTATVVGIMLVVVMKERSFTTARTAWIGTLARPSRLTDQGVRGKLMFAMAAKIFLITMRIFAVAIERMIIVALGTSNRIYFYHEDSSPFGRYSVLW